MNYEPAILPHEQFATLVVLRSNEVNAKFDHGDFAGANEVLNRMSDGDYVPDRMAFASVREGFEQHVNEAAAEADEHPRVVRSLDPFSVGGLERVKGLQQLLQDNFKGSREAVLETLVERAVSHYDPSSSTELAGSSDLSSGEGARTIVGIRSWLGKQSFPQSLTERIEAILQNSSESVLAAETGFMQPDSNSVISEWLDRSIFGAPNEPGFPELRDRYHAVSSVAHQLRRSEHPIEQTFRSSLVESILRPRFIEAFAAVENHYAGEALVDDAGEPLRETEGAQRIIEDLVKLQSATTKYLAREDLVSGPGSQGVRDAFDRADQAVLKGTSVLQQAIENQFHSLRRNFPKA